MLVFLLDLALPEEEAVVGSEMLEEAEVEAGNMADVVVEAVVAEFGGRVFSERRIGHRSSSPLKVLLHTYRSMASVLRDSPQVIFILAAKKEGCVPSSGDVCSLTQRDNPVTGQNRNSGYSDE